MACALGGGVPAPVDARERGIGMDPVTVSVELGKSIACAGLVVVFFVGWIREPLLSLDYYLRTAWYPRPRRTGLALRLGNTTPLQRRGDR